MARASSISNFIGRLVICVIVLFLIYLIYGPAKEVEADMINGAVYLIIVPLILIPGTIIACLIIGIPLMLLPKIKQWWLAHSFIAFIGLTVGFILIVCSANFTETIQVMENETEIIKESPNEAILGFGWFMTAFFLLHFHPKLFIVNIRDVFSDKRNE